MITVSVSTFNIQDHYRTTVPRDLVNLSPRMVWDTSGNLQLDVAASGGTPKTAVFVSELRFLEESFSYTNNPAKTELLDILHPNAEGDANVTYVVYGLDHLNLLVDKELTIGSKEYRVIQFNPAIKLLGSNTQKTFTVSLNSEVASIDSGSIAFLAKGWTMKEANF